MACNNDINLLETEENIRISVKRKVQIVDAIVEEKSVKAAKQGQGGRLHKKGVLLGLILGQDMKGLTHNFTNCISAVAEVE